MGTTRKRKATAADTAEQTNSGERKTRKRMAEPEPEPEMEEDVESELAEEEEEAEEQPVAEMAPTRMKAKRNDTDSESAFVGEPIPPEEAAQRWPKRYLRKDGKKSDSPREAKTDFEEDEYFQAKRHYSQAEVDGILYNINDDSHVKADDDQPDYIARIVEFFEGADGDKYFTAQWFYRAEDTSIKNLDEHQKMFDKRRVFLSEIRNINPLDCIVSKLKIARVSPNLDLKEKEKTIPECDYYYDMKYLVPHLTFASMDTDTSIPDSDTSSTISSESGSCNPIDGAINLDIFSNGSSKKSMTLLDLYSGCGGMSTGLCLGAKRAGVDLVARWAVDMNEFACESLKLNHPETEVRNEAADDFLCLLKEWEKLISDLQEFDSKVGVNDAEENDDESDDDEDTNPSEVYEVEKLLAVVYGDPNSIKKRGLYFKVKWKGYDSDWDTWEPIDGLSDCKDKLMDFVRESHKNKLLPLPGDVDFICGGPPCQGVSGFNRFRNRKEPLADPKNHQLLVYMDIIQFLKPKYILMENVVDILKFKDGFLGRYALGRLVSMNYQARIGMMPAGAYGVPQFRMRVFLWGAHPLERLPQYPLPTHEVSNRGVVPKEFEDILVDYENKKERILQGALYLEDAVSDLPHVENDESKDERPYDGEPRTNFQQYIRLKREEVHGLEVPTSASLKSGMLFDHRPLKLNADDYERVQCIPKKKGANFRDLPGVKVGENNIVYLDTSIERPTVASGKPLVPDYAISFVGGRSTKPFSRLWWDEIIATVVTRAEPHNQSIIHPIQDRVMTVRELARLQGFPDFYKFCGPIKQRYIQIGNAVAVPVGMSLGYTFGRASQRLCGEDPTTELPFRFPQCLMVEENLSD